MPHRRRQTLVKKAGRCGKRCTDQPFCYNDYIHKRRKGRVDGDLHVVLWQAEEAGECWHRASGDLQGQAEVLREGRCGLPQARGRGAGGRHMPCQMPVPQVDFDWKTVQLTFLDHQVCDPNRLCEKAAKADVELTVPMELFEPFVEALQATKKYGDVKNAGAAVWLMARAALRQFGEDDGRAYTPIMKLFGRAAIPTTTYEGVKSIIDRKMKAGEISQPWEIFENMLGETYGARGRKAD